MSPGLSQYRLAWGVISVVIGKVGTASLVELAEG